MKEFKVKNHAPSYLPEGYEWVLAWADEFDGTELDMTKWAYRTHIWGKRHPGFATEGVELDGNSNAVFHIFEKDGEICSPHLQTEYSWVDAPNARVESYGRANAAEAGVTMTWPVGKFQEHKYLHKYGYYECRCKLQKERGWWSAFWLQSPVIGTTADPAVSGIENDIMESFEPGRVDVHVNHFNGYGEDHDRRIVGKGMDVSLDEYHTFGLLWEPDGYTWYINGVQDGEKVTEPVSHIPQFILISTEVNGYRQAGCKATEEARAAAKAGDVFVVDHVRVFDIKG